MRNGILACGLSIALMNLSHADNGQSGVFGAYLSFHGDPPPSMMGFNLGANIGIVRVTGGVGVYNTAVSNSLRYFSNYTYMPIGFVFYWLGDVIRQVLTTFKVKTHKSYEDYRLPYFEVSSILSYGGALKLVPIRNSPISPLVGVGVASFQTHNSPMDLPDSKTFVYFPLGLDAMIAHLNLGAGYNFCPAIDNKGSGFYFNIGGYF